MKMTEFSVPKRFDGSFACVSAAWQAHEAELLGFLKHQLPDGHAAEDLLQDVFLKAMRQGEGFCSLDNPRAWLFQVARNAVIDRGRVAKHHVSLEDPEVDLQAATAPALEPVDALAGCVDRVLGELAPEDAAIIRSCDIQGATQRDYAERHGLSLPATKSRLLRARQRLRDRLTSTCRVNFDPVDGRVCGHDGRADGMPPSCS
jgi:RNA polymerase sigma-70 factor (ECF subfamily)